VLNSILTRVVVITQSQTCIRKNLHEPRAFLLERERPLNLNKPDILPNSNGNPTKILHSVPFEKGFHFFTASRKYTGITATSLFEFSEKLQLVSARSVTYHFRRHDFREWINETIGDDDLAAQVAGLDVRLPSENLRKELVKILQKRLREVEKLFANSV
jgi:hypothetical protein